MEKKKIKKSVLKGLLGVLIGGVLGFAYYKVIGCSTGTCPITANPVSSIIYGGVIGSLFTISR